MNLGGVVNRLATGSYTVTRGSAGSFGAPEDGRYVPGGTSTFTIKAVITPLSEQDLERLPEGQRTHDRISIFTVTPLLTAVAPGGAPADVVTWQGKQFEVEEVNQWSEAAGYGQYTARKVGQ